MVKPFVVGISGGSAAGKTMIAGLLARELADKNPLIIAVDRYFVDQSHLAPEDRAKVNYDIPSALDFASLASDLERLISGEPVRLPVYDYSSHSSRPAAELVTPAPLIIVEGILLFYPPQIKPLLDFRLYVEAEKEERLRRRIARDTVERGRTESSVIAQFNQTVEPAFNEYTAPTRRLADFTLDWNTINMQALGQAATTIRARVV